MAEMNYTDLVKLLSCHDYRSFIKIWIQERNKIRRFGFSDIARFGNFSARSFPRDVALGQKRLTLLSMEKFITGMKLPKDLADYFRLLILLEEEKCRTKDLDLNRIIKQRKIQKQRILRRASQSEDTIKEKIFELKDIPSIYAALGRPEKGATANEIASKTGIGLDQVFILLQKLEEYNLARKTGDVFFPLIEQHAHFEALVGNSFQEYFISNCKRSISQAEKQVKDENKLFFSATYSVAKKDLPNLKKELRTVLIKFIDHAENPDGDSVVHLVASLI